MEHYWIRVDRNPNADLPDTKNLYGYRWSSNNPPQPLRDLTLQQGVHRIFVDGKDRMTVYGKRNGQHVLLVFGESNVNKIVWMFGLAPLMFSLIVLYSILWWSNRRAKRYFSPITRLANALEQIDWVHQSKEASPFQDISTNGNASANSAHFYGTTFDVSSKRFKKVEDEDGRPLQDVSSDTLKLVLSEVLRDLRKADKCYIKYELKQGCFHITTRGK
jgi:hypothetical protein